MDIRTVGDRVHSHNSNCIYSVAKSNRDSIEFSLLIAKQRAVGFILAWSLAFLQTQGVENLDVFSIRGREDLQNVVNQLAAIFDNAWC